MDLLPKQGLGVLPTDRLFLFSIYNFFIFAIFLFNKDWGISLTLFEIAHLIPVLLITRNNHKLFYTKVALAILVSIFYWIRADEIIISLALISIIGLNLVIFQESITNKLVSPTYLLKQLFIWIEKIVHYTTVIFSSRSLITQKFKLSKFDNKSGVAKRIVNGVLIAIPIVLVLILLFASADNNFEKLFSSLFDRINFIFDFKWIKNLSLIWNMFIEFALFWIYLCFVYPFSDQASINNNSNIKNFIEKLIVGVLVAGVFAVFILTQFKSVSFILEGFATGNLNPSLFVREGFFQLLISCLIGLGVFYFIKNELAKNIVTSLLLVEIFLVALTAGEKVWLYQYRFGLTQARVWGIFFLLFLLSIIGTLFLNLKNRVNHVIKWQMFILSFTVLIVLAGFVNVDKLIATLQAASCN